MIQNIVLMISNRLYKNLANGLPQQRTYKTIFKHVFKPSFRSINVAMVMSGVLLLSACGVTGSKSAKKEEGPDITAPPVLIGEERVEEVQTDPDEVISYDEWQKRRRKAAAKAAAAKAEKETENKGDE